MIKLSFKAPCEDYHKAAYHDAIVLALEKLAVGDYVPWKSKHRGKFLSDEQLNNPEIKSFFADLRDEERAHCSLTCGKCDDMVRVINSAGAKYDLLSKDDKTSCKAVLKAILPYEQFKVGGGFKVENGEITPCDLNQWGGVEYLSFLDVEVCSYCNDAVLPHDTNLQYDHYLNKDKYPYLRMNLYNLVPCCPNCNQYRRNNIEINNFDDYPYPYRDSIDDEARFNLSFKDLSEMQASNNPINPNELILERRTPQSPERSKRLLERMGLVKVFRSSGNIIRKINDIKRDVYYLHGEVQDGLVKLLGKQDKSRMYDRFFHFPFDRNEIDRVQDLKICLDMVSLFAPELEIRGVGE